MQDKEGLYDKAKQEMRTYERILAEIPGFRGYKEKEIRRETDKLIRDHIYRRMREARSSLRTAFRKLSAQHISEALGEMDQLIMTIDRVEDKINHASYGYAGFYNVLKIREDKLDKMIAFDNGLIDHANKLVEETKTFEKESVEGQFEKVMDHINSIRGSLISLEETFDSRQEEILEG